MSKRRVADLPRDRQAQLILQRALAHIDERRAHLVEIYQRRTHAVGDHRDWPMSLANPRWVVELVVEQTAHRARAFRLTDEEQRELTDALLVALALEGAP